MCTSATELYFYKYRDVEKGLKIITEGTLGFSSPHAFNDPFDCMPHYDTVGFPRPLQDTGDVDNQTERKWREGIVKNTSIFCASRNPCSILMWSHYANDHKGIVVELYWTPDIPNAKEFVTLPVEYSAKLPEIKYGDNAAVEKTFLTKCIDWSYEEEERIILYNKPSGAYPFPREHMLKSVIAGALIKSKDLKQIEEALNHLESDTGKRIPLYRAALSTTDYKVYIPHHPNPRFSSEKVDQ